MLHRRPRRGRGVLGAANEPTIADTRPCPMVLGADDAFDQRQARIRRWTWGVIAILLLVGGFAWRSPDQTIASPVLRAIIVYGFVLFILRLAGKRTLGEMTTFDLVILLILSEAIQPAMVGGDNSMTNAMLIVAALVGSDVFLGVAKDQSPRLARWLDDVPTVLVRAHEVREDALKRCRIGLDDVVEAARKQHGIMELHEIAWAILERDGTISIVPSAPTSAAPARANREG
ncbi:MAG: DUF421 domain-containing protein [Gemmatimonadaceae bacterium]